MVIRRKNPVGLFDIEGTAADTKAALFNDPLLRLDLLTCGGNEMVTGTILQYEILEKLGEGGPVRRGPAKYLRSQE